MEIRHITLAEWRAEAEQRFGDNPMDWEFVCPSCGHVASVRDWKDAGAKEGEAAFSCIGRRTEKGMNTHIGDKSGGPCNYAGGGLFRLNPVHVINKEGQVRETFEFAPADEEG